MEEAAQVFLHCFYEFFKFPKVSQWMLADMMQLKGVDMDKTAIKHIENGERYVTDIELKWLCEIFNVSADFFIQ